MNKSDLERILNECGWELSDIREMMAQAQEDGELSLTISFNADGNICDTIAINLV